MPRLAVVHVRLRAPDNADGTRRDRKGLPDAAACTGQRIVARLIARKAFDRCGVTCAVRIGVGLLAADHEGHIVLPDLVADARRSDMALSVIGEAERRIVPNDRNRERIDRKGDRDALVLSAVDPLIVGRIRERERHAIVARVDPVSFLRDDVAIRIRKVGSQGAACIGLAARIGDVDRRLLNDIGEPQIVGPPIRPLQVVRIPQRDCNVISARIGRRDRAVFAVRRNSAAAARDRDGDRTGLALREPCRRIPVAERLLLRGSVVGRTLIGRRDRAVRSEGGNRNRELGDLIGERQRVAVYGHAVAVYNRAVPFGFVRILIFDGESDGASTYVFSACIDDIEIVRITFPAGVSDRSLLLRAVIDEVAVVDFRIVERRQADHALPDGKFCKFAFKRREVAVCFNLDRQRIRSRLVRKVWILRRSGRCRTVGASVGVGNFAVAVIFKKFKAYNIVAVPFEIFSVISIFAPLDLDGRLDGIDRIFDLHVCIIGRLTVFKIICRIRQFYSHRISACIAHGDRTGLRIKRNARL